MSSASGAATTLSGFAVDAVLRAPYLAGLGRAGRKLGAAAWPLANLPPTGAAPSGCDVNNSLPLVFNSSGPAAPILWTGDVDGGLRIKWKGPGTAWDSPAYTGVSSWSNSGLGMITVDYASSGADSSQSDAKDLVRISASTGLLHLTPTNPSRSFHLDLCITPFKQRAAQLNSHFQSRYFQIGYPDHHMYTPEEVAATGATIATIHQGVDSEINPYINWPFDPQSVALQTNFSTRFAALSNPNHTIQNRFKLYYTARELTNHVAELFPLRALNGEILQCNGLSAEGVANGGSSAWLLEHLVEDFCPCWQQNLGNGEFDAAVCDIGISRWSNYYLEVRFSSGSMVFSFPTACLMKPHRISLSGVEAHDGECAPHCGYLFRRNQLRPRHDVAHTADARRSNRSNSSNRLPQWQHAFPEFRRPSAAIHAHAPFCESSQESSLDAYAAEPRAMQYHDIRLRERKIRLTVLSQVDSLWFGESFR